MVEGDQFAQDMVELTGCPDTITATVTRAPDDASGYVARLEWDNHGEGTVEIRWDQDPILTAQPDAGFVDKIYTPEQDGTHSVRITDSDDVNRFIVIDFEIPLPEETDLDLRIEPGSADGYTATAIWGPGEPPPDPTEQFTISSGNTDGYTATATWNLEE